MAKAITAAPQVHAGYTGSRAPYQTLASTSAKRRRPSPHGRTQSPRDFSEKSKVARNTIFAQISKVAHNISAKNIQPKNFQESMRLILSQNTQRLPHASGLLKARLLQRQKELKSIQAYFESNPEMECLGFIGWGNGCFNQGLSPKQHISSVDGFLYRDKITQAIKYYRLSSNLEHFRANLPKTVSQVQERLDETFNPDHLLSNTDLIFDIKVPATHSHAPHQHLDTSQVGQHIHHHHHTEPNAASTSHNAHSDQDDSNCTQTSSPHSSASSIPDSESDTGAHSLNASVPSREACPSCHNPVKYPPPPIPTQGHESTHTHPLHAGEGTSGDAKQKRPMSQIVEDMIMTRVCDTCTSKSKHHHEHEGKTFKTRRAQAFKKMFPSFYIEEENHKSHKHFNFTETNPAVPVILSMMRGDLEGCPCCTAGMDFDEFAAAVKEFVRSLNLESSTNVADQEAFVEMAEDAAAIQDSSQSMVAEPEALHSLAEFGSIEHWGIALGIALPFSVIGMTAAVTNIKGCAKNLKALRQVIDDVDKKIWQATKENNATHAANLRAFKKALLYSKFDTEFNLAVPGVINGAASAFVATTLIWKNPFALPLISLYATCQMVRNLYDLGRLHGRDIPLDLLNGTNKTDASGQTTKTPLTENQKAGIHKINTTLKSKRAFFGSNAAAFCAFAVGALMVFLSIPALALGVGAATLPVGLALLGAGAAITGVINNKWPNKFKPRNGDLGLDRRTLTPQKIWEAVGRRARLKKVIKTYKRKLIRTQKIKHRFRRFWYKVLTALPWGAKKGKELKHKDNKRLLRKNRHNIKLHRKSLLTKLLNVDNNSYRPTDSLTSQLKACEKLGLLPQVMDVLKSDAISDKCGSHKHNHKHHHHKKDPKQVAKQKRHIKRAQSLHAPVSLKLSPRSSGSKKQEAANVHHHDEHATTKKPAQLVHKHKHHHHEGGCCGGHHKPGEHRNSDTQKHHHKGHEAAKKPAQHVHKHKHHHHEGGCCGGDKDSFMHKLDKSGLFLVEKHKASLKCPSQMGHYQKLQVEEAINQVLFFNGLEKLRYQERGLGDLEYDIRKAAA